MTRRCLTLMMVGAALLGAPRATHAQDPTQQAMVEAAVRGMSTDQILARLRASGMSRDEVRRRLSRAGYDPALADAYFDRLEAENSRPGSSGYQLLSRPLAAPDTTFLSALTRIGILSQDSLPRMPGRDSLAMDSTRVDSLNVPRMRRQLPTSRVYGRALFAGGANSFDPVLGGPVDESYRVGPGDQLMLVLSGDVEQAYSLDVARAGFVLIPDVGQVYVTGLTVQELRNALHARLARIYSGIGRGANATTRFDVSVVRVRTILVYLVGDVEVPGGMQVSALSKVFNALYLAGGPTDNGSFRNVQVRRAGSQVVEIDLYDYLLRGDTRSDIRLEQGDVIFVPPAGARVDVDGSVRRPGIYELRAGDGLLDVLSFAGGLEAGAFVRNIQIDRILPVSERTPGRDRVIVNVDLQALMERRENVTLEDGDKIEVFAVSEKRRNRVSLKGDVHRPGEYEFRPGETVAGLLARADGLLPSAYVATAHVIRQDLVNGSQALIRVTLAGNGANADSLQLMDLDEVVVFDRPTLLNAGRVRISGEVKTPGIYPLAAGASVQDLILEAGGFVRGAVEYEAEVVRMVPSVVRGDTLAISHRIPVNLQLRPGDNGTPSAGAFFELADGDQIFIRKLPGHTPVQLVHVSGEVAYPGSYAVERRSQTISGTIERAGGLAREAYAPGFRLIRGDRPVAANLERALREPGSRYDLVIEPGDRLEVPRYDPTVLVTGAVAFEARIPYHEGWGVGDYVRRAGGTSENADRGRTSVVYANGSIETAHGGLFRRDPSIQPGSSIVVPERESRQGLNWETFLNRTLAVLSTLATVALAVSALDR